MLAASQYTVYQHGSILRVKTGRKGVSGLAMSYRSKTLRVLGKRDLSPSVG